MAGTRAGRSDFESESSLEPETLQSASLNGIVLTASEEEPGSVEVKENVDNTALATSNQSNPEVSQIEESDGIKSAHSNLLDLVEYSSAAELEALDLEKLKAELQARGLKCGGTLQECAARLFLLKTTPLDKLPKKLLAKPTAGGK